MKEEWKEIPGYEGYYQVSDRGRVRSLDRIVPRIKEGKAYSMSGPEALTYDELASELSKALGRPISHIKLSPSDLKSGMLAEGMPEAISARMLDLERYFREGRASSITNDIEQVTGREPRRFAEYARETAATGVWDVEAEEVTT